MLTMMREMLRSKFAGLLFGLIIVSMGVWGITDIFTSSLGDQVVKAGNRGFTIQDFDVKVEQFLQRQRDQGGMVSRREAVEQGAVDQLYAIEASRMANLGYAEHIGAEATLNATLEDIRTTEAFADPVSGDFNTETYRRILRSNQLTPERYQVSVRDSMTLEILADGASGAMMAPGLFTQLQASYLAENRDVSWFIVDADSAGALAAPTDEELTEFYESRLSAFSIPERRVLSLISLSSDDFIHTVEVSTEDLRAIYEAQKAQRFSSPETRRYSEVVAPSEAVALDSFGRLAGGASAEAITAANGASVTSRTALQSEIADLDMAAALFGAGARAGTVVGPFERNGRWIVARLDEVVPGTPVPFEEVSDQISDEYSRAEAESLFRAAESGLFDMIGAGLTLDEMAAELETPVLTYMPVVSTGLIENGPVIATLATNPDLLTAAFDGRIGEVTDPVSGANAIYLVEVQDILPPRTPPLDEIRDRVAAAYSATRESEGLSAFAQGLVDAIESGEQTMDTMAAGIGAQLQQTARPISRAAYESAVPQAALVPVFAANAGDVFMAAGPAPNQMTIARVDAINAPEDAEIDVLSGLVRTEIEQGLENDILMALETDFRNTLEFEANGAALDAYKRQILDQQ